MKKILLSFCLLMASFGAYSQKSYINVVALFNDTKAYRISLSGDVPSEMENYQNYSLGEILNMLSEKGYEVEFMSGLGAVNQSRGMVYLLSKKTSNILNSVRSVQIDDEDVTEMARYNLQGTPVKASEKGVQIIVYSNYTTRTVIVE